MMSYRFTSAIAAKAMLILALFLQSTAEGQSIRSKLALTSMPKGAIENPFKPSPVPAPLFSALSSDFVTGDPDSDNYEISAVAIPQGGKCGSSGKIGSARLISSVGRDLDKTADTYYPWSYIAQELNPDFSPRGEPFDLTPKATKSLSGVARYFPGTDNQFVRLSNGDLIAVRLSYIGGQTPYWNGTFGGRVGTLTVRSRDCGETWEFNGFLDPAKIILFGSKGAGAYPRLTNDGKLIQGGGDREEFYADPWDNQTVYTTQWFAGNKAPEGKVLQNLPIVGNALIFASADGGKTWGNEPVKMFEDRAVPIAMTSTRAKRLFLFTCIGGTPTLHYVKDGKYVQSWPVFHGDPTKPENFCAGQLEGSDETSQLTAPGYLQRVKVDVSISRVDGSGTHDTVRVVYPAVVDDRRVAHVVVVRIQESLKLGDSGKTVTLLLNKLHEETISAASKTGNIIYPTFIETDRVDLPKTSATNTAVLYWYETAREINVLKKTVAVRLFTRYSVFREDGIVAGGIASKPQDLSVTNGSRRSWSPIDNDFIGDYMRGAFAYDGKLRFIAQWPERRPEQKLRIRYNVVTVQP